MSTQNKELLTAKLISNWNDLSYLARAHDRMLREKPPQQKGRANLFMVRIDWWHAACEVSCSRLRPELWQ